MPSRDNPRPPASPFSGPVDDTLAFGKAFGSGVKQGATSMVTGLWSLAKGGYRVATDAGARAEAWETTKQAAAAVKTYAGAAASDPAMVYRDARNGALSVYNSFDEKRQAAAFRGESPEFWGGVTGRGTFEVASVAVPGGIAGRAAKLKSVGKASTTGGLSISRRAPARATQRLKKASARPKYSVTEACIDEGLLGQMVAAQRTRKNVSADARLLAERSTRVSKKGGDWVVIGPFKPKKKDELGYIAEAKKSGGVYFDMPAEVWNAMSLRERDTIGWAVNREFLNLQLERGMPIRLKGISYKKAMKGNSTTKREIKHLEKVAKSYGYVKEGDTWRKVSQ